MQLASRVSKREGTSRPHYCHGQQTTSERHWSTGSHSGTPSSAPPCPAQPRAAAALGAPVFLVLSCCCCCSRPVHLHRRTSWYLIHPARRQSSLPSLNSCTLPCRPRPPPSRLPSPLSPLLTPRSRPSASLNHTPGTFSRFQVVLPLCYCIVLTPSRTELHCTAADDFHSHDHPLLARAPAAARPAVSPLSSAHRHCQQHQ